MKREHQETSCGNGGGGVAGSSGGGGGVYSMMESGKSKMWEETIQPQPDAGVDELLAVLGYKVRSSDMAEVAQKLEQLEMAMGNAQQDILLSHLASDTVHYNPSDLATWLQSMLTEANPSTNFDDLPMIPSQLLDLPLLPLPPPTIVPQSSIFPSDSRIFDGPNSDYDLRAIPGGAICSGGGGVDLEREKKRMKPSSPPIAITTGVVPVLVSSTGVSSSASSSSSSSSSSSAAILTTTTIDSSSGRPIVIVDSQETGVRLVHTLMACAEAIQQENLNVAGALVKQIGLLAVSQAGAMRKVATYFAEALARRIYRLYPQDSLDSSFSEILEMHFYETCPYLKFAHFTANQAILEAFAGKSRVHVIDFSMKQGMQWPALMQALALRPGGPPAFRLTGIGPPQADNSDALQQVGWKLAQLAETIHVEFEYRGFVANSLADLDASMLDIRPSEIETVAVNSVFELHRLLAKSGRIEKVLSSIKAMNPKIVTIVEQEANHNGPVFMDRFTESLHYYSTLFDSLEGCGLSPPNSEDQVMSEVYLGRQICNVVACEGIDRVERHETLNQWRGRLESAGFKPVHLGSNAFKQASMLLALFAGGDGYRVEENHGCLMLGWHTRPLIATSAWQLNSDTDSITQ